MDRRCVSQVERKSRPFPTDYNYKGRAAINSTFTDCRESHRDGNMRGRRALAFPVIYIENGSLCAVDNPHFLPAIPSTYDASSLGQIHRGLEIFHVSGLNFACELTSDAGGSKPYDSQAPTCFSLGSSKSSLNHICFEAYLKSPLSLGSQCALTGARSREPRGRFPPTAASASYK